MSKNLMTNSRNLMFAILMSISFLTNPAHAQGPAIEQKMELTGTRKQLATIIFSGLAGAILGLSTLSFYGRPQEHLSNIAVGFAVGVIGGTIYTTYRAATKPYDVYDLNVMTDEMWQPKTMARNKNAPALSYVWEF